MEIFTYTETIVGSEARHTFLHNKNIPLQWGSHLKLRLQSLKQNIIVKLPRSNYQV